MHLGAQSRGADKKPINGIVLRALWQKIGPAIMPTELFGCFRMTVAPAEVPRWLVRLRVDARLRHVQSLVNIPKARLVGQELAVAYTLLALSLAVDIPKVPVIKELIIACVSQEGVLRLSNIANSPLRLSSFAWHRSLWRVRRCMRTPPRIGLA